MSTNHTTNYGLCQWLATDQVQRTDFNQDNLKIDTALKDLSDQMVQKADQAVVNLLANTVNQKADQSALNAAVTNIPKMVAGTYTGTGLYGEDNPNILDFSDTLGRLPLLVIVKSSIDTSRGLTLIMPQGAESVCCYSAHAGTVGTINWITWSGNQVRWYGEEAIVQMNEVRLYRYFAIG